LQCGAVSDQKTSKFFVFHQEFHVGVKEFIKVRDRKYNRRMVGPRWNLEAEIECFPSPCSFKTYANIAEGKNQVIAI
jgi:hypothetical protein